MNLWIHLLLMANHKEETSFIWNGKKQTLKKGQLLTGRKKLSKKTGITPSQVYKILKYLEKEQQIEQQTTTKFTIITIKNWGEYQRKNNKSNNRVTTEEQQSNTFKNDNNVDKRYICSFKTFWKQYPRKESKKRAETMYKREATSKKKETKILEGLKRFNAKWKAEETEKQYIPLPTSWLNAERWEDEITVSGGKELKIRML